MDNIFSRTKLVTTLEMFSRGQELPVFVTGVSKDGSLCSVWGQTDFESFSALDELIQKIDANDKATFKPVSVNDISVGDVVIAKYQEDGMWYRAQILNKESGMCRVFFMDYGNKESVSVDDMVYGPEQYFNVPPLATKFILADFQANDGQELSEDEMATLGDSLLNLETDAQVLHEGSSGVPPTLRPFVEKSSQVPIAHTIIQSGCGTMYENDHFGFPNIPRAILPPGKSNHVYVAHSDSAVKFWLQLVAEEDKLMELEEQLQDVIPNLSPIPSQHIKKGAVCIANYEESYYRGVVSTVDYKQKTAVVYFIDYGNSAAVPFPEILRLPDEYCTLPAQAIECSLKGSAVNSTDFGKLIESDTVYARVLKVLASGLHIVDLSNDASGRQPSRDPVAASSQLPVESKTSAVITSYPSVDLEEDALVDVCISHVEENDQFYCQLLSNAKALDVLMCAIQEADLAPLKGAIKEGTCCLARSPSDSVIYRAQILSGSVAGPHVKYVDFGVTETVQPRSLYVLPNDLAEIPVRAVCCTLSDSSGMTSAQVQEILNRYLSKKPLIAEVVCKTPRSHEVVLYDTSISDEPLVTVLKNKQSHRASAQSPQSSSFTAGSLQPPNIPLGKPITVVGSLVLKPTVFFAQFASFPVEDLESLGTGLHEFYTANNVPSLPDCKAGDVCVTMFSEDGAYYRARVKARRDDVALISFIDYGNQEKKNISELKILVPQFCKLPVAGALFDLSKHYDVADPEGLSSLVTEQELTVICEGQSKDGFICKLPEMESNMALLKVLRPKQAEAVPQPVQARPTAQPTSRMVGKPRISDLKVPEGTSCQVIVPYAQDPENIVIQLLKYKDDLDTLMDLMDEYCNSAPVTQLQVSLGDFVIAKYSEDGGWYRASITGLKSGGQQYEVYFVDYGNYDTVALSNLREIPPKFSTLPAQALCCCLNGIAPESAGAPWEPEHNNKLCDALLDVELTANIVSHRSSNNTYMIELTRGDGASLNKTFLQSCGRLSRRYGGSDTQQSTGPPRAAVPANTRAIPHKQVKLDEYTDVVVPYGLGVDNFICQFVSDAAQLDEMQEAIAEDYAASSNTIPRPAPGMFCCALYSEDGVWYRAEIREVNGNTASVYFVDYGNHETVDVSSLRALKDKYYLLPRQAIECELFGVAPVGARWSQKANSTFLDMATGEESIVGCPVQKKSDGVYVVELVHSDSVPYHEKLIADGHARAHVQQQSSPPSSALAADKPSAAQKPVSLVSNVPVDVYIAHVDSVSKIYCQLISEATKLEDVMAKLSENYSNLGPSELRLKNAGVGSMCCAKYSGDNEWYRGEILAVAPQKYHVRFVDYGNEEWVDSDDVRQILKQLLSLPPQAIHVSLENVSVIPGKEADAKTLIDQHTEESAQVIPRSRSREGVHAGTISINGTSLTDLLVQAGIARPGGASSGPVARAQESPRYAPPVAAVPRGPQPVIGKYQINRSVEPNNQYKVIISWVENPLEFYCQSTQSEETLVQLSEKLRAEYEGLRLNEMVLPSLPTGTACVTYYEEDGNWYRGTVLKVRGQEAMVKYVDYGNRSKVPLSKVKAPSNELIEQEMEAVQCSLKGINAPTSGEWPEGVIALFQELMSDQPVLKILSLEGDRYIVDLNTNNCRSISDRVASLMRPKKSGWSDSIVPPEQTQSNGARYGDRQQDRQKWGGRQQNDYGNTAASGDRPQYQDRGRNRDSGYGTTKPEWGRDKQRGGYGDSANESRKPAWTEPKSEGGWGDKPSRDNGRSRDDGYRSNKPNWGGNASSKNEWEDHSAPKASTSAAPVSTAVPEKLAYPESVMSSGLHNCFISAVVNPLKFYMQFASREGELDDFATKVSSEYSALSPGQRAVKSFIVNDPCCALFHEDGAWYRALVTDAQGSQATVLFVDYGNSTTVQLSDVRSLTQELVSVPLFAVECKPKDMHQYTDEDILKLNGLLDTTFKVEFVSKSAPFEVVAWDGENNLLDLLPSGRLPAPSQTLPEMVSYEALPKPTDGVAYVSHVVNPGEFYLQFAEHEDQLTTLVLESAPSTAPLGQAVVGAPCAAMFSEDSAWYRARILSVSGPKAMVQFVDHGNCEEVDVATLQQVHTLSPPIGVQCQLGPQKAWSEEDLEKFNDAVLEKPLQVSLQGNFPPYTAVMRDEENGKIVNEEFAQGEAETPSEVQAESYEYPPIDFSSLTGRVQVFVSHVDTPSKFYVQLASMETQLNAMLDHLDEKYSSGTCEVIRQPHLGMACCAQFTDDDVFYRAKIIDMAEDGAVTVQFIDYGNCDTPPAEHIYQMQPDCAPMALQCSLTTLAEPEGGWTDEVNDKLHEMTDGKALIAEFHSSGELCQISLYEEEQNIATLLQEAFPHVESAAAAAPLDTKSLQATNDSQPEQQTQAAVEEKQKGKSRRRYFRLACPQEPLEAYVSAVSSPGKFYVQPVSVDDDLASMEETLCSLYKNGSPESLDAAEVFPGQMCCAQSSDDGEYYRALVTNLNQDDNTAEVLYVDYGNSETQKIDALKRLEEKALSQPVLTLICKLAGVEGEEWTQEETTKFMEETEEKKLTITFQGVKEPYAVTVLDHGEDIARRLFAYRLKTGDNGETTSCSEGAVEQAEEADPEEVQAADAGVNEQPPTADDEEEVAKDEQHDTKEQGQEVAQDVKEESGEGSLPSTCQLTRGESVPVTVSWVTSPSEFFIQLISQEDELAELEERLQEFYSEGTGEMPDPLQAGLICAARYAGEEEAEKWYRARVQSVDEESVEVFFLDWGNTESLSSSSLRSLDQEFLTLPTQCLKCSLSNVQPITDEWPEEAVTWFEETVTESESLKCVALQNTGIWEVDLIDASEMSVAATLKQKGYAIEITEVEEEQRQPTFATTIPAASLDSKVKVQVSVSHLESPDNFWVQVKPNSVLEQLEGDMMEFYSSSCPSLAADIQVDKCYVIKNEESWDRARVKVVADQYITVHYVDYGYDDDVEAEFVYPLCADFTAPVQCFQCRLVGVQPKEGEWSDEATELMRELTDDKCLLLQIVNHANDTEDGKYAIRLLDMGIPVSQVLADNNVAELVHVKDLPNSMDTSGTSDISEGVQEYVDGLIAGAKAIVEQQDSEKSSEDVKAELLEVTYLHGENPGKFYVQLCDNNDDFKNLEKSMEELYQSEEQDPNVELNKDDNILVHADDQYYRASVLQVQDDQVEVLLVDYGGSRTVPRKQSHVLGAAAEERLFSLASQCMECRLEGIEAAQWTEQANEFFEGLVKNERLSVRILSQTDEDIYSVYMYVLSSEDRRESQGSSVNMQLVQGGHATVIPGCQLDIDLDLESEDNAQQECSFLEESKLHSNSIGSLHNESLYAAGSEGQQSLSRLHYSVGDEVRMRVSAVTDPDNIVVVDCMDTQTFTVLSEQMQQYYNDKSTEEDAVIATPQPGQSAAILLDSTWQRCEIISVADEAVEVLLVDSGLQRTVQKADLRVLDQRFCALPTQACRVSLDTDADQWPQDVRDKLEEACGVGQADVTVTVTITSDNDGLVANIINKDGVELSSLCKEDTSPELSTDSQAEEQAEDEAEDEAEDKVEDEAEESEQTPQAKEDTYATSVTPCTVKQGESMPVTITAADSPLKFWCQMHKEKAAELAEKMKATYSSTDDHSIPADAPLSEGAVCGALIPAAAGEKNDEEVWSRVAVCSSYDDVFSVRCLDSGRDATVKRENLRRLTHDLAQEAAMAVLCQIPTVLPPGGEHADWPEACSSQLEQYADVVMTVKEVPDDGAPVLVTLTADTLDVRQNLIDLQLAKPIPHFERKIKSANNCQGSEVMGEVDDEFDTADEELNVDREQDLAKECDEYEEELKDDNDDTMEDTDDGSVGKEIVEQEEDSNENNKEYSEQMADRDYNVEKEYEEEDSGQFEDKDEDSLEKHIEDQEDSEQIEDRDEDSVEKEYGEREEDLNEDQEDSEQIEDSVGKEYEEREGDLYEIEEDSEHIEDRDEDSVEKVYEEQGVDLNEDKEVSEQIEDKDDSMEREYAEKEDINEDEDSEHMDELVVDRIDLSKSLKEEIEDASLEVENMEGESGGDEKQCDERNSESPNGAMEKMVEDAKEDTDEYEERIPENEKEEDEIIDRIAEDEEECRDGNERIIEDGNNNDPEKTTEPVGSEQVTEVGRKDVETYDKEAGELYDVDDSADRSDQPMDHASDNDESLEMVQSLKSEVCDIAAEIKPVADVDGLVISDKKPNATYERSEMLETDDDGEKFEIAAREIQDEGSSYSLNTEDVEDLVSTEDSREDNDSGLVQDVHTDKSQGTTEGTGEDTSCEAADFHDLEGTEVTEDPDLSSFRIATRSIETGDVFTKLEQGDGDATRYIKNDVALKKRLCTPSIQLDGDEQTMEALPQHEEVKDESGDYLTAADIDEAVAE